MLHFCILGLLYMTICVEHFNQVLVYAIICPRLSDTRLIVRTIMCPRD